MFAWRPRIKNRPKETKHNNSPAGADTVACGSTSLKFTSCADEFIENRMLERKIRFLIRLF